VTLSAPADDDGFDAADVLVDVVALALTDVDPLFLGLAEDDDLAEGEEVPGADVEEEAAEDAEEDAAEDAEEAAVDAATCVDAEGVQVEFEVAPTPVLPGPAEWVLVL